LPLAFPAANGGRVELEQASNVSHRMTGIHRGQGSFTDVVRGVRALHPSSLSHKHYFRNPL